MEAIDWIFLPLALGWAGIYAYRKLSGSMKIRTGKSCAGCGSSDGCTSKPKEVELIDITDIKPLARK